MDLKEALRKFQHQQSGAQRRGIKWQLTFQQWLEWWGVDLDRRGPHYDQLGMCRFADRGPYALDNIYKGYPKDNRKTAGNMKRLRNTLQAKADLEAARDASAEYEPEHDEVSEDEAYLRRRLGVRSSYQHSDFYVADKRR